MIRRTIQGIAIAGVCAGTWAAPVPDQPSPRAVTVEQVRARMDAAIPRGHPRLLATNRDFDGLRSLVRISEPHRKLYEALRAEADEICKGPLLQRTIVGRRMTADERRLLVLALVYRVSGEKKYLDRAREEMRAAAAFVSWNPSHFLDPSQMTFFMAVAYDWLYTGLDEPTRKLVREAIVEKGLKPSLKPGQFWMRARHNWGQVCHGSLAAGALVVMDQEPELAQQILHRSITDVTYAMEAYVPNGTYPEGPGYWEFGTTYNVILIDLLETALGSDFGLASMRGLDRTAEFQEHATGPTGYTFNYADSGADRRARPAKFWFAARFNRPDWVIRDRRLLEDGLKSDSDHIPPFLPLALLWMSPPPPLTPPVRMALAWKGEGAIPVAMFRTSWTDSQAAYVGLKAGSPSHNHGHMDAGSFVYEADGVRWAEDLGAQNYHSIESRHMDLWNRAQGSDRWKIFRLNNFSHNTLTIDGQLQRVDGFAPLTRFSERPACAVADLSTLYAGQAKAVQRGVTLLDSKELLVQDHVQALAPGKTLRWNLMTKAKAGTPADGRLTLTSGKARMNLEILRPVGAKWVVRDASKPVNEWDAENPGVTQVYFEVPSAGTNALDLAVLFTPGSCSRSLRGTLDLQMPAPAP